MDAKQNIVLGGKKRRAAAAKMGAKIGVKIRRKNLSKWANLVLKGEARARSTISAEIQRIVDIISEISAEFGLQIS